MPVYTKEQIAKIIHKIYYAADDLLNAKTQKFLNGKNSKKKKTIKSSIVYSTQLDHDEASVIDQIKGERL